MPNINPHIEAKIRDEEPGLLDRFYELYEKGRKSGAPQNFIDYFEARTFLFTEVEKVHLWKEEQINKAHTLGKQEARKEMRGKMEDIVNPFLFMDDFNNATIVDIGESGKHLGFDRAHRQFLSLLERPSETVGE